MKKSFICGHVKYNSYTNASGPAFSITPMAAGPNLTVQGSGTAGRLTKWAGFTSSNSFIGDSTIFESKAGLVGIGTDAPTSKLTVAGVIESTGGLVGVSPDGFGVLARSTTGTAVLGISSASVGVFGMTLGNPPANFPAGIVGVSSGDGIAGQFRGKVEIVAFLGQPGNLSVAGTLSKGAGTFKIDHPLDPGNKYLYHSFVESPDMMNIYNGNITTDENGDAVVELPDYFDALNKDFRYQLTVIGTFAQAIVAQEIKGNHFTIKTSAPNVKVSWQVTGIRNDAFARKYRIKVEEDKPEPERGYYLHPEAFDQPEEKSINWALDPERMMQLRKRRPEAEQMRRQQPNQR